MALDAETVIDRRRLKRRLTAWRLGAVALGLIALGLYLLGDRTIAGSSTLLPHVARVTVSGIITNDRKMNELIDKIGKSDQVRAAASRSPVRMRRTCSRDSTEILPSPMRPVLAASSSAPMERASRVFELEGSRIATIFFITWS